jgi:lipoprotein-releasing system permease protein
MGYPLTLATRYLRSKKRNMVSISTALAIGGVALGVTALAIVMSVTGGFKEQFREKVLGVNAHVLVLKYSIDFREYRDVMKKVEAVPGVIGVAPFVINPMMVTRGDRTATGVLLKGVDPVLMPKVLDLPKHIVEGSLDGMRKPGAKPPERTVETPSHTSLLPDNKKPPSADSDSDAGADDPLFRSIKTEVDQANARLAARADAGADADPLDAGAPAVAQAQVKKPTPTVKAAPFGNVVPDGGYKSELPDDDVLPESIDPDPCRDPAAVAAMPGVIVGRTLSKQLNATIGDCVQITSPTIGVSYGASAHPPIAKQFRVIAIFEAGFDQYDSKLVYTDLYEAQAFYEYGDSVTGVEMRLDDIDKSDKVAAAIDKLLYNGVYNTMTWGQLNHGLFTALLIQQWAMSIVLGLIIVVAAFTVIATLIMIVLEKKKEIALLKAIGARDAAILRTFLYQGSFIGVVGTTIGVTAGYTCCRFLIAHAFPLDPKVYFISSLPVSISPWMFIVPGAAAIVICTLVSLFPASYAARLRPADGLRAE